MRHKKSGRKFGRNTPHRRAMLRNLAGNLVLHEKIETTEDGVTAYFVEGIAGAFDARFLEVVDGA